MVATVVDAIILTIAIDIGSHADARVFKIPKTMLTVFTRTIVPVGATCLSLHFCDTCSRSNDALSIIFLFIFPGTANVTTLKSGGASRSERLKDRYRSAAVPYSNLNPTQRHLSRAPRRSCKTMYKRREALRPKARRKMNE